jgi:AcrR family transcriptional regulator
MAARKKTSAVRTKDAVFASAASLFSSHGFNGVSTDDIANDAGVNKAMIYYHFSDKLALYRAVVCEGLQAMGETVGAIAQSSEAPTRKLDSFVEAFVRMTEVRPWMPAIMLREIAEGAPRLDPETMAHMRRVIENFGAILRQGQQQGVFRAIHPLLAYESIIGPIIINAARERVATQPGRKTGDLPMLVSIPHADVVTHMQDSARRMLSSKGTDK